jgi:hypothetical protein
MAPRGRITRETVRNHRDLVRATVREGGEPLGQPFWRDAISVERP